MNKLMTDRISGDTAVNIHGVGVYFPKLLGDYFSDIEKSHGFQELRLSDKPSVAFRKGIYLSEVTDDYRFNLLRCSTNLGGPTEGFSTVDRSIIHKVNEKAKLFFSNPAEFNHVLAQIYTNSVSNGKEHKARIAEHSDKTKDMPKNGMIAFCTFYDSEPESRDAMTTLRFRLKKQVTEPYIGSFDVVLEPGSVFIISLEMNRLYTHRISPSRLPVSRIPTRMGYVIRCSNTEAVHKDGQTYIVEDDKLVKLQPPDEEGVKRLRELYRLENLDIEEVDYYRKFYFSMNSGDYKQPIRANEKD